MVEWTRNRFRLLFAIALLAALFALPASSSHTCVHGADDYNQCVAQTAGDETAGASSSSGTPWYEDPPDNECDGGDACR